ncbi:MAG: hypothetical protein ABIJ39_12945 [Chloroflexota bacterium]
MSALILLGEVTDGPDVTWLLWVALGFFLVMVLVGWLASRNKKTEEDDSAHSDGSINDSGDHH